MAQGALLRQYFSAGSFIPSLVLTQQLFTSPAHSAHFSFFLSHTGYGDSVVDCGIRSTLVTRDLDFKSSNEKETLQVITAFCLFVRTLPIYFALVGRKRKYIKLKTTTKLKGKQTSISAAQCQFLSFATFLTPFGSRYRLPLSVPVTIKTQCPTL
jgi:hypothetical protein